MLAFSNDYYGFIFRVTQSVELFCTYVTMGNVMSRELIFEGILLTMVDFRTNYAKDVAGKNNSYEMISGHRRMHAAIKAGLETIPAIVRDMEDDDVVVMVDSKKTSNCKLLLLDGYCTRVCLKNNF